VEEQQVRDAGAIDDLVTSGRTLVSVADGVLGEAGSDADSSYDRVAAFYDRLVPNRLYSRLAWKTDPDDYVAFAREALADADGPFLDAAGGSGVFTAGPYREADRRLVFCDLSVGMLERARDRIGAGTGVTYVQADALDSPFRDGAFATVACMGSVHVFGDPAAVIASLTRLVAPGGRMFLSALVAEERVGSRYLAALHKAGEAGPPMTEAELVAMVEAATQRTVLARRSGSMAYLIVS
jgi:ubiquinone/menaquinone biosynthesis C-methylase UbiE